MLIDSHHNTCCCVPVTGKANTTRPPGSIKTLRVHVLNYYQVIISSPRSSGGQVVEGSP